jgi:hypothetical protein
MTLLRTCLSPHLVLALASLCGAAIAAPVAARTPAIQSVSVGRAFFNPASGESIRISVVVGKAGRLDATVLDRDGYPVRTLAAARAVPAGRSDFDWDGHHDDGRLMPDEAYSLRLVWTDGTATQTWFPANQSVAMTPVQPRYYARSTGTLVYDLPAACRVHVQAGTSVINPKTKSLEGPVLKTIVNREPRAAGRTAEHWNGFDETGQVYVPDLPGFVTAIATTPLPENSLITVGNRKMSFLEYAAQRRGHSLFTYRVQSHQHHAALSALDDVSPPMQLEPLNAVWSAEERVWVTSEPLLRVRVVIGGPVAARFTAQPAKVHEFVNGRLIRTSIPPPEPLVIAIPSGGFVPGINQVSVNWQSLYGGVAASTLRVRSTPAAAAGVGGTN